MRIGILHTGARLGVIILFFSFISFESLFAQPDPGMGTNQVDSKGRKQGTWVKNDAQGIKIYEGSFKDDKPVGEFRYFYPDGKLRSTLLYPATGNIVLNTAFYQNGIKMAEGNYIEQKKDGLWKYYNDLGELASEENWAKGLPAGVWKVYYQGLKVMEEFTYRNGQKEGAWKQYFPTGSIKAEAMYIDGLRQGPAKFYFPDGAIMIRGNFRNDLRNGIWENYKQNGQKESVREFDNGKLLSETYYDKELEKELKQDSPELKKE
jgi:antitoxin component YwqK of YwqJK toxin-antitoxin module